MDLFDVSRGFENLENAVASMMAKKILVMSFNSDWLFPSYQSKEMVDLMRSSNKDVEHIEINTYYGHDSFLIEYEKINPIIKGFLEKLK